MSRWRQTERVGCRPIPLLAPPAVRTALLHMHNANDSWWEYGDLNHSGGGKKWDTNRQKQGKEKMSHT